jgi:hypothetical protein
MRNTKELELLERIHAAVFKYFGIKIVLLSLELVNIKDVVSICKFYRKNTFNNSLKIEFNINYIKLMPNCKHSPSVLKHQSMSFFSSKLSDFGCGCHSNTCV